MKRFIGLLNLLMNQCKKSSLRSRCSFLTSKEFEDIFQYFCNKKWIYKLDYQINESELRLSRFVDSIPGLTYPVYKSKVKDIKLLILGAGTGGSYLLEVLIKLGFHNFTIIDNDKVEEKILVPKIIQAIKLEDTKLMCFLRNMENLLRLKLLKNTYLPTNN